jgi:hypothetical protein
MISLSRNRNIITAAIVVMTCINVVAVVAYRPSVHTRAPTSLNYNGGVTTTTTSTATSAASDAAVANYMRKRYGSNTAMNTGIALNTIYSPPTMSLTETLKVSDAGLIIPTTTTEAATLPHHRNKWGVDNQYANEYWFDKRIHTLGNHGFWGAVHAALAPISTKVIDMAAYDGIDIRKEVRCYCCVSIGRFVLEIIVTISNNICSVQYVHSQHAVVQGIIQNDCW